MEIENKKEIKFTYNEIDVINKHDKLVFEFYTGNETEMKQLYMAMLLFLNTIGNTLGKEVESMLVQRTKLLQLKINRFREIQALDEKES